MYFSYHCAYLPFAVDLCSRSITIFFLSLIYKCIDAYVIWRNFHGDLEKPSFIFRLSSLYFLCVTRKYAILSNQHWNLESTDAGSVRSGKWFLLRLFSFKITHHCLRRITQYWDWDVNKLKKWNRTKRTKKWIPTKSDKIRGPLLQSFPCGNTTLG